MTESLMKPKLYFVFRQIMENERARLGFLSSILRIRPEDIKETHILSIDLSV